MNGTRREYNDSQSAAIPQWIHFGLGHIFYSHSIQTLKCPIFFFFHSFPNLVEYLTLYLYSVLLSQTLFFNWPCLFEFK